MILAWYGEVWNRGAFAPQTAGWPDRIVFASSTIPVDLPLILLLLAGGWLVYTGLRHRHVLIWNLGWFGYLLYRSAAGLRSASPPIEAALPAAAPLLLVLCVTLFAASATLYTRGRRWLVPLAVVAAMAGNVAFVRGLLWPDSAALALIAGCLCAAIAVTAVLQLALFSYARREFAPWLNAALLVVLTVDVFDQDEPTIRVIVLVLGALGLLALLLDDSRVRQHRLAAFSRISNAIAEATQPDALAHKVLEELRTFVRGDACWFWRHDSARLVLRHHHGISEQLVGRCRTEDGAGLATKLLRLRGPAVLHAADREIRDLLAGDGLRQLIVLPLAGTQSVAGFLCLGLAHARGWSSDEVAFLATIAGQVGRRIEKLFLFERVARSQRDWMGIVDALGDLVFVHDDRFQVAKLNRAMQRRIGKPYGEVVGQPCSLVLPRTSDSQWIDCPYCDGGQQLLQGVDPCFGGKSLVTTSTWARSEGTAIIHVIHDTTDRYAAEERYRRLFDQVQEGVFTSTPDGRTLDCNEAFARMLGYTREEVLSLDIASDIYAAPWQREAFCRAIAERNYLRNYEVVLRRKDGSSITALESSFAVRRADGEIECYQGFLLDISDKKRAEEEIRRRNRELQAVNAIAIVATQSFDLDEVVTAALAQAVELFSADTAAIYLLDRGTRVFRRCAGYGYRSEALARMAQLEVPEDFMQAIQAQRTEILTHHDSVPMPESLSTLMAQESLLSWMWAVMWAHDKIVGVLAVSWRAERELTLTDQSLAVAITRQLATSVEKIRLYHETRRAYEDLRRTQEQLLQSEKMSAIGQLVSGVAHELNNPLTAILGYAQLLEAESLDERCRDYISKLHRQAQRTQRLVQNLLSFARRRKVSKALVDPRQVLEDTLALRDYDLHLQNIQVVREFGESIPRVFADAHQLEQVFLNIINNAVDAMSQVAGGGTLRVRMGCEGERVFVEFHDSGPGISEPHRVFDPFYTTKPVGKGTGLGLSICYGIIKEHGGEISAANHPQGGAVFRINLLAGAAVDEQTLGESEIPAGSLANCKILIVDDEDAVLEFEREALSAAGAQVTALTNPERALLEFQQQDFDVVLLDCMMPGGWTGTRMFTWLAKHCPGIQLEKKVILCSSSADDQDTRDFAEQHQLACLPKPFDVKQLLQAVRSRMEQLRAAASANAD